MSIQPLVEGTSGLEVIRAYCGWHIAGVRRDVVTLDGNGSTILQLPTLHVVEIHSVTVDGVEQDMARVEWSASGMIRGRWPDRFRSIVVDMDHGFERMPAVVESVQRSLDKAGDGMPQQVQTGPFMVTNSKEMQAGSFALSDVAKAALDNYRLPASP